MNNEKREKKKKCSTNKLFLINLIVKQIKQIID